MTSYEAGQAGLVARARTLAADSTAAEVSQAFAEAGIPSVLLKGPVLDRWLYSGQERDYVDADLLVRPDTHARAEGLLEEMGFERVVEPGGPPRRGVLHSRPWARSAAGARVDLHRTLFGTGAGPDSVWAEVNADLSEMEVVGAKVKVLGPAARAFVVASHAAQHEGQKSKAGEDLRRAVETVPLDVWQAAAQLAERLHATPTMSLGLSLAAGGAALADRLGLVDPALARAATREGSRAGMAIGFERLSRTEGWGARLRLVGRELFPSRDFIYGWSSLARRGRRGMVAVYLWRPVWLLASALPGLLAWLRYRNGTPR